MVGIFIEVLTISFYMSGLIIMILVLNNKIFYKYTEMFKYTLCIGITLRLMFITRISIPAPEILSAFKYANNKNILDYMSTITVPNNNRYNTLEIACYIWIIGIIVTSIYYIHKQFKFYRNIKNLKINITEKDISSILESQKNDLNIRRSIKLSKLDGIYSPMIVGIINPEIIIPNRDYTHNNLNYIFRHELIHYKRKDNLFKLLLTLVSIIYWFNPVIFLLRDYFLCQCELSCDELAAKNFTINESKEYSLLLLGTMKYKNKLNTLICASYLNTYKLNLTKYRIENILSNKNHKKCTFVATLFGLTILISTISFHKDMYSISSEIISNDDDRFTIEYVDYEEVYMFNNK